MNLFLTLLKTLKLLTNQMIDYFQNLSKGIQNFISILLVLSIAVLHFMNPPDIETFDSLIGIDKLVHFLMFFFLTSWFVMIYEYSHKFILLSYLVFFGLLLELMQMGFFIHRSFEWFDWIADSIGVIVGFFTISKWI
ncbi:MAG: VanZ family protein [Gammaproteobacteria bacterium]|nr:VanZ family protein [Gammaproteobacteria bacterium]